MQSEMETTSADHNWSDALQSRLSFLSRGSVHQPYSRDVAETVRGRFDAEVAAMGKSLALLKRHRNATLPIMCLPPEVFAIIFAFHKEQEPNIATPRFMVDGERATVENTLPQTLGWIKATHVTHFWREVALANPVLWSDVTFGLGPDWAREFLHRSKNRPILLDIWSPRRDATDIVQSVVDAVIHRVHAIQMSDVGSNIDPNDFDGIGYRHAHFPPAPILTTMHIQSDPDDPEEWPDSLLSGPAPYLRDVTIFGQNHINWYSGSSPSPIQNLTRLAIYRDRNDPVEELPAFSTISKVLEAMPQLESLTLHGADSRATKQFTLNSPSSSLLEAQPVHLPSLKRLDLRGKFDIVLPYIARIHWHPAVTIALDMKIDNTSKIADTHTSTCVDILSKKLSGAGTDIHSMRALRVRSDKDNRDALHHEVAFWRREENVSRTSPDFFIRVSWNTNCDPGPPHIEPAALCQMVSLDSLRIIDVSSALKQRNEHEQFHWNIRRWRDTFSASHRVVRLTARGTASEGLFNALHDDMYAFGPDFGKVDPKNPEAIYEDGFGMWDVRQRGGRQSLFPAIESLTLMGMEWKGEVESPMLGGYEDIQAMLKTVVVTRSRRPGILKTLLLDSRFLPRDDEDDEVADWEEEEYTEIHNLSRYISLEMAENERA